jgi:hypothetical protein
MLNKEETSVTYNARFLDEWLQSRVRVDLLGFLYVVAVKNDDYVVRIFDVSSYMPSHKLRISLTIFIANKEWFPRIEIAHPVLYDYLSFFRHSR